MTKTNRYKLTDAMDLGNKLN